MENRILIVDDEERTRLMFAQRLFREGYICTTANDGREALNRFYHNDFSLIISDISMPEMDGMELLTAVKSTTPKTMVIMVTAFEEIDLAVEAMRRGACDFLIKPVDLDLLVFNTRRALKKKRLEEEVESYHLRLESRVQERALKLRQAMLILEKAHVDSVRLLAEMIEAKDPYTRGHSDRVRRMSMRMGVTLGFDEKSLENLVLGALLHDIGKIGIRDDILNKQESLNAEEYQSMREHPLIGAKMLEGIEFLEDKIPMIRHHHEHYDGSGYPDGLEGYAIPLEARIISVPDAFDAMSSARPHRGTMPLKNVLTEMERGRGRQFDPAILEIFLDEGIYRLSF